MSRRPHFDVLEPRLCLSTYTTVDLIPLPGHDHAKAFGLNDNGLAVGTSHLVGDSTQDAAVVWSVDDFGEASVSSLPGIGGARSIYGLEVNNQGMIAGESKIPEEEGGYTHAVVWTGALGSYAVHDLGTLGETADGNFVFSGAKSVSEPDANGNIWVVGDSTTHYDSGPQIRRGVLWQVDSAGNVLSMTDLEPSRDNVDANDVRVIGGSVFVVGDFVPESPIVQACIWQLDLSGSVVGRTDLGTAEFTAYQGNALNNHGDVAGTGYNSAHERNGFLYQNSDGSITGLGSLGNSGSYAWGINDSDVVVGKYDNVKSQGFYTVEEHAFVWESGTMHNLLDQVSDRTFWLLFSANDVNDRGEIVGSGRAGKRNDSQEHGFLALPEDAAEQHPPEAVDDNYTMQVDTALTVAAPGVLNNDTDADGDSLGAVLVTGPANAESFALLTDGSFTYSPSSGFTGTDSFTYVANDGTADSNAATVTIVVTSEPVVSTLHVGDLGGSVVDLDRFWQAVVTIYVVDEAEDPVADATVNSTWSGNTSGSESVVTDADGLAVVESDKVLDKKDSVVFTVDSIVHASFDYDPADNIETTIIVYQDATALPSMVAMSESQTMASEPLKTKSTTSSTQDRTTVDTLFIEQHTAPEANQASDEAVPSSSVDEAIADLDLNPLDDGLLEELALAGL